MGRTNQSARKSTGGRIVKVTRDSQYWKDIQRYATTHIAVSEIDKMDSPPVGRIRLMGLKMYGCAGRMFISTLRIRRTDGLTVDYEAWVWYKPWEQKVWNDESFSRIEGSERGRKRPMLPSSKNPFWSYKKVIKAAKGKWQKLTKLEKVRFMGEAAKKDLKGKQKDLEGERKASP